MQNFINKILPYAKTHTYKKGSVLFLQGQIPKKLLILKEGVLRLYKHDENGNELTLHYLRAPTFVAEITLFEKIPYPASSIFECDSTIVSIEFEKFKSIQDQEVTTLLIKSLFQKIKALEQIISKNMLLRLKPRLCKYIIENQSTLSHTTQKQIAQDINTTRESLSRTIKELKNIGAIDSKKGKIIILDIQKLLSI